MYTATNSKSLDFTICKPICRHLRRRIPPLNLHNSCRWCATSAVSVERIGCDSLHVPNVCGTILEGIQAGALRTSS
jgi:hypothetical protein